MTNITLASKFLEASLYLIRIIAQILYYCWFSNEVKLKVCYRKANSFYEFFLRIPSCDTFSSQSLQVPDMVFKSDWPSWDNETKKILLVIMTRATRPIEFSSGYLVTLNLDSFMAVSMKRYAISCSILHMPIRLFVSDELNIVNDLLT